MQYPVDSYVCILIISYKNTFSLINALPIWFWYIFIRERPFDFYRGVGTLLCSWKCFFFARLAFYFIRGTVLDIFSQDHAYITNKKVYYISVDSDLLMDMRLIKYLVLVFFLKMGYKNE